MFYSKAAIQIRNPHCLQKWVHQFEFLNPALSKREVLLYEKAWLRSALLGESAFPHQHFWQQTLKHPFQNTASAMLGFTSVTPYCHFNMKNKKGNIPKLLSFPCMAQRRPCCTFSMPLSHKPLYRQQQINYNHGFSKSPWQDILIVAEAACAEMIGRKSAPFPHPGLLVGSGQWKTSTAALMEPSRGCWGPEVTLQLQCHLWWGLGWLGWEGTSRGDSASFSVLHLAFIQLTNTLDALIKRDHENQSRDKSGPRKTEKR